MANVVYTLKLKKDTSEYHLFEATPNVNDSCTPKSRSICNKMSLDESAGNHFACKSEDSARKECANLGRKVCGICVSHLYTTY